MVTPEDVNNLLTESDFRAWLEKQQPTCVVGKAGESNRCPIANYLAEGGVPDPGVDDQAIWWSDEGWDANSVDTPKWASAFVYHVDGGKHLDACGTPRTARECLEVLDKINASNA